MSLDNVELFRRIIDAYNARDIEPFVAGFDPSVEVNTTFSGVSGGVYHGHEGVRRWQQGLQEAWGDQIRMEPDVYFDLGEHTLVVGVLHGRGLHSGVEVQSVAISVALCRTSARWWAMFPPTTRLVDYPEVIDRRPPGQ